MYTITRKRTSLIPAWHTLVLLLALGFCRPVLPCFALEEPAITPTDEFFVLSGQGTPSIPADWRLKVEGEVNHPLSLSMEDLMAYTPVTRMATLECIWNYWLPEMGWIGNANWTGVPLSTLIDEADPIHPSYTFRFFCLDNYRVHQDLPEEEIILAYGMNDGTLPVDQGYPIRAVVPGYPGNRWAQWVERIEITSDEPTDSVGVIPVHSQIFSPEDGGTVPQGTATISGVAFVGSGLEVVGVEVSTDGGEVWQPATLLSEFVPNAWKLWEFTWDTPDTGTYQIVSRAEDSQGNTQEEETQLYGWRLGVVTVTVEAGAGICPAESLLGASHPHVETLRRFRDRALATNTLGRRTIRLYYENAESVRAAFDRYPVLKGPARNVLESIGTALQPFL
jgi:DMSO/TMAO reductase YedYZ molybdopterin-dependent catalytic subunit